MNWDAFFTVHSGLDREGPGLASDVHWALRHVPVPPARVLDAGSGPGADSVTLANALPEAEILAVDTHPAFVTDAQARLQAFGPRAQARVGDMMDQTGPFDLIWCAGAIYFVGITQALLQWRAVLSDDGHVAFSQAVLPDTAGEAAARFWAEEPGVTDADGIADAVAQAGYDVISKRLIMGAAWEAYYTPMEARIAALRAEGCSQAVAEACDMNEAEINAWKAACDEIAYLGVVARPSNAGAS